MPKAVEEQLKRDVNARHPEWPKERKDAYVYGTLRKTGWKPSTQTRPGKKKTTRKRKTKKH